MPALESLDLTSNQITDRLPKEMGVLTKLQVLNLARNQLYGTIPAAFGNISSLVTLDLGTNFLNGSIPSQVGELHNLKHLVLRLNHLSGLVPPNVFNKSSLLTLVLASNRFEGTFPPDIGDNLSNLLVFHFCFNQFTGTIPHSIHNMTKIQILRFAHNYFHGMLPPGLENLPQLSYYNVGSNKIVSVGDDGLSFIRSLMNNSHLDYLAIDDNQLEGLIPETIGNLSKDLSVLNMGGNRMYGNIPPSISNLRGLSLLNLSDNLLSGEIPPQIGKLGMLQMLGLARNRFSGNIPTSLGNLQRLIEFDLSGNSLIGEIPASFGNFVNLFSLDLSNNMLEGSVPKEALTLPHLSKLLNLSNNLFSGSLPKEIGLLQNVVAIDISNNHISGNIVSSVSGCKSLEVLIMARNEFSGSIPRALQDLRGLRRLDLSSNHLSGSIPSELQNIAGLQFLNLSFNDLEGAIPIGGVFEKINNIYLEGNPKLCLYSSCPESGSKSAKLTKVIVYTVVFSTLALFFVIGMVICLKKKKSMVVPSTELLRRQYEMVTYDELRSATRNFNEKNLIGKGSFGSVYKGNLKQGVPVAIKVLDMNRAGSITSFLAECEALRNVRHRNLVKLITACSSIDFSNMEFRALIYELLSHGSLDEWIQGQRSHESGIGLNILERVNIAIDIASAINYLHHDCRFPIIHCDLKPSNILLDEHMTAKVGDFGLARLLMESTDTQSSITSTHVLRGSIGYLPPEYGYGVKATKAGDVYSFGVTLLELFTGKTPTDEYFTGELNLVKWVESCFPNDLLEVIDFKLSRLCVDLKHENQIINSDKQKGCLIQTIEVALSCTVNSPTNRIDIKDALSKLKNAKDNLICSTKKSVSCSEDYSVHDLEY
ncbi:probable LRR receptor-like serine/threonine-protein kinase At3g47570 [Cucurbita pepo subsp. pepo]|uniref:probable LRR receptor-like serine/threonine-protein kinase At3g47570 n=1 Tax=Cucurbita pepo subsp. pepo TaxID=3664 RepID=UPI000C9D2D1B|nr:probable LRR receptor-like serine/threonine-protein kinase At3g47570 [Cucurbita pepo subsp. pepo]